MKEHFEGAMRGSQVRSGGHNTFAFEERTRFQHEAPRVPDRDARRPRRGSHRRAARGVLGARAEGNFHPALVPPADVKPLRTQVPRKFEERIERLEPPLDLVSRRAEAREHRIP